MLHYILENHALDGRLANTSRYCFLHWPLSRFRLIRRSNRLGALMPTVVFSTITWTTTLRLLLPGTPWRSKTTSRWVCVPSGDGPSCTSICNSCLPASRKLRRRCGLYCEGLCGTLDLSQPLRWAIARRCKGKSLGKNARANDERVRSTHLSGRRTPLVTAGNLCSGQLLRRGTGDARRVSPPDRVGACFPAVSFLWWAILGRRTGESVLFDARAD